MKPAPLYREQYILYLHMAMFLSLKRDHWESSDAVRHPKLPKVEQI